MPFAVYTGYTMPYPHFAEPGARSPAQPECPGLTITFAKYTHYIADIDCMHTTESCGGRGVMNIGTVIPLPNHSSTQVPD
ncbi:hypothetical protein I315_01595 [Cryptococcus gattii Ru294]|uniref:Uncharacterized protein n=2 Tax=Cryptococcus gattii TaxID=37769 RepID=E6R0D2_CRYGW|nr:Hypothetical Protein CGB_B2820C [Cryptococcus gattii WM276]KIR55718.1 hypothetical protein I315_01595 [Cryptococcus gattii Ru294]KIR77208.1 hypothetical protein I306_05799 [Cryptococcus gattii EJB2]KIY36234.1 hypothetical protein I305_01090 [Cryptococcus gattii E566]KJE06115.1 hypothetical protein I311_00256 [Cryptococcus gattii NT-10]ADV20260.1 Hypothetical Protein CGB_B2820C [Cryptococcus gattii WM276]